MINSMSILPIRITLLRLIASMVTTVVISGTVYVSVYNYWQDTNMKTNHKRNRITRLAKIKERKSELEKFKQFGRNDKNNDKNNKIQKYDGQINDRTWIKIDQLPPSADSILEIITQDRNNTLQFSYKENASVIFARMIINGEVSYYLTVYPGRNGKAHRSINDYIDPNRYETVASNPVTQFINNTAQSDFTGAVLKDNQPREPLYTSDNDSADKFTRTIGDDINNEAIDHNHDRIVLFVIRPIHIKDQDRKFDNPTFIQDEIYRRLYNSVIDRRGEGNVSVDDYYVQPIEIIAHDPTQQPTNKPMIYEATNLSVDQHIFDANFIPIDSALKKVRRAQTDVKSSRIKRAMWGMDGKKRAFAISEPNLRQFLTDTIDKDGSE